MMNEQAAAQTNDETDEDVSASIEELMERLKESLGIDDDLPDFKWGIVGFRVQTDGSVGFGIVISSENEVLDGYKFGLAGPYDMPLGHFARGVRGAISRNVKQFCIFHDVVEGEQDIDWVTDYLLEQEKLDEMRANANGEETIADEAEAVAKAIRAVLPGATVVVKDVTEDQSS